VKSGDRKRQESAIAYHEAGHAVACHCMGVKVASATIVPKKDEYHGRVQHENMFRGVRPDIEVNDRARLQIERKIIISLAGAAAQRRHNKKSWRSYHSSSDFRAIANVVHYVCAFGADADAYIRWLEIRTDNLIAAHWPEVQRIAKELLERKTVPGDEIAALILEQRGMSRGQQREFREAMLSADDRFSAKREQMKKVFKPMLDPALVKIERAMGLKSPNEKFRARSMSAVVREAEREALRRAAPKASKSTN
jgi:hypothetical protein